MATSDTKLMTAEELLKMPKDGYRYELVRGVLRKMAPVGHTGGYYELNISSELRAFVKATALAGRTAQTQAFCWKGILTMCSRRMHRSCVRSAWKLLRKSEAISPAPRIFVAEVISPSDRYADVDDKVKEWLNAGTRMVVVVNPRDRTVSVHTPKSVITLTESDTLDGGDVVPGWRLPVAEIFA